MGTVAGPADIRLTADPSALQSGLKHAEKKVKAFAGQHKRQRQTTFQRAAVALMTRGWLRGQRKRAKP